MTGKRVAVIGGGWAGLAAAVEATRRDHHVTLFEMAPQLGGRARTVDFGNALLDNGQHILIGAYVETLALMRFLGVDVDQAFVRTPLKLIYPDGAGLQLPPGPPTIAFVRAVMRYPGWSWHEKLAMLTASIRWAIGGFRCDKALTVSQLTHRLPGRVREELLDPLCVAALNTVASQASASVFLRVLKDALFSGPGSADLLLPRQRLTDLLPGPAQRWIKASGTKIRLATRVTHLGADGNRWQLEGEHFDAVILACTAAEAARLVATVAPTWAAQAAGLRYEPIITVYARQPDPCRFVQPMMALRSDHGQPAQFAFDLGRLGGPEGVIALVISGAAEWVAQGMQATERAALRQAQEVLPVSLLQPLRTTIEKRATFLCTPALDRPSRTIAPGLFAAGDYVEGPYPATLEGAVRSGLAAGGVV